MASITAIREGLATNLQGITGLQASAYMLANPTMPTAEVFPSEVEYDQAMARGHDMNVFTVRVFVGEVSDVGAQKNLDAFLASEGDRSVKEQLESDRTLGGACDTLRVTACTGYRRTVMEGRGAILAAEWRVEVLA